MAKRSLKASEIGIKKAKQAFRRTGWTQEYLASAVGLETRQSIWKFFSGKPIERHLFIEICFQLNLEWEEIVAPPDEEEIEEISLDSNPDLEQILQTVRLKIKETIQTQCGLLQVSLDTAHPFAVEQIYTHVQVLLTPSNQRWLEVANLQTEEASGDRSIVGQQGNRLAIVDILQTHHKLVILGKPGAGKTTLLQHLATQCVSGKIYPDFIPIFISLRILAAASRTCSDFRIEKQIEQQWSEIGLIPAQINSLLKNGKVLVLLDGLDEVSRQESLELSTQIQKFSETYPQAVILITCRLAAQDYQFRGFTYVELADFDLGQVATVARKWFVAMSHGQNNATARTATNAEKNSIALANAELVGLSKAEQFLHHLDRPENEPIREMVTTPLLLHLACLVFFERAMFPTKRAKLYQAGLDILLVRWDTVRGIQRDLGTDSLSLPETLNLLSQIASDLFEQGKIYFEKSEILPIISDFLLTLPNVSTDPETLWLTSEAVLRAIVLQSGLLIERARDIYSFSHLTFQEYLTARKTVASCLKDSSTPLRRLAHHTTERRWSEVILLTLSLLPRADLLLNYMKQEVDAMVEGNEILQQALQWVSEKADRVSITYKSIAVKAFYLLLCYNQDISLALALDDAFAFDLEPTLALDLDIARTYQQIQQMGEDPTIDQIIDLWFALDFGRQFPHEANLHHALEKLKMLFPSLEASELEWQLWWKQHRMNWIQQFRQEVIKPEKMEFGWDLSLLQQQNLWGYYKANQFLVACLNSECSVDHSTRSSIETTLLSSSHTTLPSSWIAPIERN